MNLSKCKNALKLIMFSLLTFSMVNKTIASETLIQSDVLVHMTEALNGTDMTYKEMLTFLKMHAPKKSKDLQYAISAQPESAGMKIPKMSVENSMAYIDYESDKMYFSVYQNGDTDVMYKTKKVKLLKSMTSEQKYKELKKITSSSKVSMMSFLIENAEATIGVLDGTVGLFFETFSNDGITKLLPFTDDYLENKISKLSYGCNIHVENLDELKSRYDQLNDLYMSKCLETKDSTSSMDERRNKICKENLRGAKSCIAHRMSVLQGEFGTNVNDHNRKVVAKKFDIDLNNATVTPITKKGTSK